ncbi:tetratricopeptide repeat protein [Cohnella sp. GCM10027633]|uniref:tetratricopeptide repeat protein n=1 Tax=unclassified Cohnella TaxID=2636738 RepID=UPI003636AB69
MERLQLRSSYLSRIHKLIQWSRYKEALAEAEEWVREAPEDDEAIAWLAYVHRFTDADKALHWSGEAIRRNPECETAWQVRLFVAYEREDWKSFDQVSEEMLRMFPEEAYIYRLKAQRELGRKKVAEARGLLEQAISLEHSSNNFAVYAYALALSGNDDASRDAAATALRIDPEDVQTLLYTGWAADHRSDYEHALERLGAAVRQNPDNAQAREEYLNILQKSYWFYRVLLAPRFLTRMKPWQIFFIWVVCWILLKPLIVLFIVLYIASYWISKWLVHLKIFGFRRAPRRK